MYHFATTVSYTHLDVYKRQLGYGLPIYHIDRKIEEVSENFKDEAHIIYVNSKKQEDTAVSYTHLLSITPFGA